MNTQTTEYNVRYNHVWVWRNHKIRIAGSNMTGFYFLIDDKHMPTRRDFFESPEIAGTMARSYLYVHHRREMEAIDDNETMDRWEREMAEERKNGGRDFGEEISPHAEDRFMRYAAFVDREDNVLIFGEGSTTVQKRWHCTRGIELRCHEASCCADENEAKLIRERGRCSNNDCPYHLSSYYSKEHQKGNRFGGLCLNCIDDANKDERSGEYLG